MRKKKRIITPIYPYNPLEDSGDVMPAPAPAPIKKAMPRWIVVSAGLATVCTVVFLVLVWQAAHTWQVARVEYDALRELAAYITATHPAPPASPVPHVSAFDRMMMDINPHFIGWIRIEGTRIDYPVVRAQNNEQYLSLTFQGQHNEHGAIFMDYRNVGDFVPHIIIYGHNTRYGNMFSDLHLFLDADFLARYSFITLLVNDRVVVFDIFSARRTDVHDPAFFLDFSEAGAFDGFLYRIGAPADAAQIVTLSTCVSGRNPNERVIVQGVLKGASS